LGSGVGLKDQAKIEDLTDFVAAETAHLEAAIVMEN
jgi:hypothetical protein